MGNALRLIEFLGKVVGKAMYEGGGEAAGCAWFQFCWTCMG